MSIRPIDLNGMIQNTQTLSNTHSTEENRPVVLQDVVQETITQEVEIATTSVVEQENAAEEGGLDADREGRGEYRSRGRKRRPKKKEKVSDGSVSVKNKHESFDMKI